MNEIGVIGDYDSIYNFSILGFSLFPVEQEQQAREAVRELTKKGYGLLLVTQSLMKAMQSLADDEEQLLPILLAIPDGRPQEAGYARERVRRMVEQAVGSDILSGNDPEQKAGES